MNEKILNDAIKLRESILNSEEYKKVQELNNLMNNSDEIKLLSYKKDLAIMEYEDALRHFSKNSIEVINKESNMAKAIYLLNNNKIVKEYNIAFSKLESIYKEINDSLFSFYEVEK